MLENVNLFVQCSECLLVSLVLEFAYLPPTRVFALRAAASMLVNTEAAEAFQAPGTLVVNEAVEKFTALDHGSFQGLLSSWQIIYVIFVVVRLRGHRIDITHKRAPESECLVRSDQKAQEVRNNGRYTTHKRQNFIQRQQEPNTVHLLSGLNDRCFEQFLFIAAFILAC